LHSQPETLTKDDLLGLQQCLEAGMNIPLHMGILTDKPRLIASPFGPIRSFAATYTLMCAVQDTAHHVLCSQQKWEVLERMRVKIERKFGHLSPVVEKDLALLLKHRSSLERGWSER
jgi:hypothetical protein